MQDPQPNKEVAPAPVISQIFDPLNDMAKECHWRAVAFGWWSEPETEIAYLSRCMTNFHGEVSELWETHRKGTAELMCDKGAEMLEAGLPFLTGEEEETADILIRVFDYAAKRKLNLARAVAIKHAYNGTRAYRHGGKRA